MKFDRKDIAEEQLLHLYRNMLLSRMIEDRMLLMMRQGKVSKWFSGIGQEAISTGVTLALDEKDWIFPLHRNIGVFTGRNISLSKLFRQWAGAKDGFSKGRERSFHFGSVEHHICGMISHLGPQLAVADGIALAHQLRNEHQVAVAFTGEGGTSEGDFHEALNIAAVWDLPVIFVVENNGYALSTPTHEQYRCDSIIDRARGYGLDGVKIDGNNILSVYDTVKGVRDYCLKKQKPYLIECTTFRMRGHEEASGTKYIPKYLFEIWAKKDPIAHYEEFLEGEIILTDPLKDEIKEQLKQYIDTELESASHDVATTLDIDDELRDVYAPRTGEYFAPAAKRENRSIRFIDAISEGLDQSMIAHENLVIMGQDIAEYGGAFKITEGFVERYGKQRIRNTPLCESGIIGAALGLSIEHFKTVVEMQFADFVTSGFTQIVNNLAKIHYRWGQHADVVIRMPCGGGLGAGPFHSQSNEAWFVHTPGLKVVYPSSAYDAKGLLIASVNDPNPVMFFEHKALYRSVTDEVPQDYYEVQIGKARIVEEGEDISIITYGSGVHWASEYAISHPEISFDIIDLRTLLPIDYDTVCKSVFRTGKVIVLHEDTLVGGIGGEIAAWIAEHCFDHLDAPVMRCASLDTPVPYNTSLENQFLARARLGEYVDKLLNY